MTRRNWLRQFSPTHRDRTTRPFRPGVEHLEDRVEPSGLPGAGVGLVGNYYADPNLSDLAATRIDPRIDFAWPGSPAAGVPADGFSARWTGRLQAQFTQTYTLTVAAGEGVRLSVDGRPLIDAWTATAPGVYTAVLDARSGEVYDLRLEATDAAGPAAVRLSWASPSTPAAVVPASQLYPRGGWLAADLGAPAAAGAFSSSGAAYTLTAGDAGHFAHRALAGDGTLVTRVGAVSSGEAGLMVRTGTAADAAFAAISVTASGSSFDVRSTAGSGAVNAGRGSAAGPAWVKLVRDGAVVSGYTSATGSAGSWELVGTAVVPLGSSVRAGVYADAGSAAASTSVAFTGFSLSTAPSLGANLDGIKDWGLSRVFVDTFKQSRAPISLTPGRAGYPATTDAAGWPTEDFETFVQAGALGVADAFNGTYKLSFTGRADVSLSITPGGRVENLVYDPATDRTTADVTLNASDADGDWYFVLQFRNTTGGVRDVRLIRPGYDPNTTRTFTDEFLAAVAPFQTLRFMDWLHTNGSPNVNWWERALPTDANQTTNRGVAWEYVVELANAAGKDVWVNVPLHATDAYVRELATFLRDRLGRDRIVYLEYSNEVWNTIFPQGIENIHLAVAEVEAGMASGVPSPLMQPWETTRREDGTWVHDYAWAMRRVARELKDATDTFASVWGPAAINTRVRPVLANQQVNTWIVNTQLDFLQRTYSDPRDYVTAIGGTTFFNFWTKEQEPDLSVDQILAYFAESIAWEKTFYAPYTVIALSHGLQNVVTEGGGDTVGRNHVANKKAAVLDPRMRPLVEQFLTNWYAAGGGQFNWFVAGATDYDTDFGTWGLTNDPSNLDTPKFQALESIASSAPPRVTLGTPIPNRVAGTGYFGAPAMADPYLRWVSDGQPLDYPVRAPVAGDYRLTLNYAATSAGAVEVYVDGVRVATLTLAVTGPGRDGQGAANDFADSQTVTLRLGEGLHNVQLRAVTGGFSLATLTFAAPGDSGPPPGNQPPTVATPAAAVLNADKTAAALSAAGADDGGEPSLTYTWSVVSAPSGAIVRFGANGTNAAKNSTATFDKVGTYTLRVTIRDAQGLTAVSNVTVAVDAVLSGLTVSPATATVANGQTRQFSAAGVDQFGAPTAAPVGVTWAVEGLGTVSPSGLYTAPASGEGSATVRATGGAFSASATVAVTSSQSPTINYPDGFLTNDLAMNGPVQLAGTRLRLTDGPNQAGSAFERTPVAVGSFTTRFRFQLGDAGYSWGYGDGITFILQGVGTTALGSKGGGLGYDGIGRSVAIKFDVVNNAGEGVNSTGLFTGGTYPSAPSVSLDGTGIDLHSGHVFQADLAYDGTTLTVTITDTGTGATATQRYTVDIPALVGGPTAYAGFTAGTGALWANQDILNWTFASGTSAPPANQPPTVAEPARATPGPTPVRTAALSVLGADDGGEATLSYTWAVTAAPNGAPAVTFDRNGTNAAKDVTATFGMVGDYTFQVTITDAGGQTVMSSVTVRVTASLVGLRVSPASAAAAPGGSTQFTAVGLDQFGDPLPSPMAVVPVWRVVSGPGTIDQNGVYTAPADSSGTATVEADVDSIRATATVTITSGAGVIDYSGGFTPSGLTLNRGAAVAGGRLRLVDGGKFAATSAFAATRVGVTRFTSSFRFQAASLDGNPWSLGDGLTFLIASSDTAVGAAGGGLGSEGIGNSVALKFDMTDNRGEGVNSTGVYLNGAAPTTPSVGLDGTGIDLHTGHVFQADLAYDGTTLTVTITDTNTGATATQQYAVDVRSAIGGTTGFVGFTAGTGALTGRIDILDWTFTPGS